MDEKDIIVSVKSLVKIWALVREKLRTEDLTRFARTERGIYAMWARKELDRRKTGGQA